MTRDRLKELMEMTDGQLGIRTDVDVSWTRQKDQEVATALTERDAAREKLQAMQADYTKQILDKDQRIEALVTELEPLRQELKVKDSAAKMRDNAHAEEIATLTTQLCMHEDSPQRKAAKIAEATNKIAIAQAEIDRHNQVLTKYSSESA